MVAVAAVACVTVKNGSGRGRGEKRKKTRQESVYYANKLRAPPKNLANKVKSVQKLHSM